MMREAMGLKPADIYIPGGWLYESQLMAKDPVKWVEKYLAPQRTAVAAY